MCSHPESHQKISNGQVVCTLCGLVNDEVMFFGDHDEYAQHEATEEGKEKGRDEIEAVCSVNGINDRICEDACRASKKLKRFHDGDEFACVFVACAWAGVPRSIKELCVRFGFCDYDRVSRRAAFIDPQAQAPHVDVVRNRKIIYVPNFPQTVHIQESDDWIHYEMITVQAEFKEKPDLWSETWENDGWSVRGPGFAKHWIHEPFCAMKPSIKVFSNGKILVSTKWDGSDWETLAKRVLSDANIQEDSYSNLRLTDCRAHATLNEPVYIPNIQHKFKDLSNTTGDSLKGNGILIRRTTVQAKGTSIDDIKTKIKNVVKSIGIPCKKKATKRVKRTHAQKTLRYKPFV